MNPGPVYLAILFSLMVGAVQVELTRRNARVGSTFFAWLAITGILGCTAKLHDFSERPPRIAVLIAVSIVAVFFVSTFSAARKLIESRD